MAEAVLLAAPALAVCGLLLALLAVARPASVGPWVLWTAVGAVLVEGVALAAFLVSEDSYSRDGSSNWANHPDGHRSAYLALAATVLALGLLARALRMRRPPGRIEAAMPYLAGAVAVSLSWLAMLAHGLH